MVATASTEHSYWLALAFFCVKIYATHATQAIAFEWHPGLTARLTVILCDVVSHVTAVWSSVGVLSGKEYQPSQVRADGLNYVRRTHVTCHVTCHAYRTTHNSNVSLIVARFLNVPLLCNRSTTTRQVVNT